MGLPALRHESITKKSQTQPRLRVVKPQARPGARKKRKTSHAAAYQAYVFFASVVVVVAVIGMGRVWLSVQAAQASIDSSRLRREIKAEKYVGDMLEVQQSALATPSRIQAIAGRTMGMAPAGDITYLRLPRSAAPVAKATEPSPSRGNGMTTGVLEKVMGAAAGEAQVLLVGDVGLTSSR